MPDREEGPEKQHPTPVWYSEINNTAADSYAKRSIRTTNTMVCPNIKTPSITFRRQRAANTHTHKIIVALTTNLGEGQGGSVVLLPLLSEAESHPAVCVPRAPTETHSLAGQGERGGGCVQMLPVSSI